MPFRPEAGPLAANALVTEDPCPSLNLVLMGGPGCGKGTLSKAIVEKFGVVHISVGDILRKRQGDGSEIGEQVHEYLATGRLVPDELAIDIIKEELMREETKQKGWLLDNFPRTVDQAVAMIDMRIIPHKYIHIEVPDHVLIERCLGRMIDPETNAIYHKTLNPPPEDQALRDRLVRRADDSEEAVKRRLELFHDNMDGVIDFFDDIRKEFDGQISAEKLANQILTYIKPDAPLYAFESKRPALTGADDIRAAFDARQEECEPLAEGEEESDNRPKGDDYRNSIALDIIAECLGKRFDESREESRQRMLTYKFASQHAVGTLDMLINVLFAEHDSGDSYGDSSWTCGNEPAAPSMDTWGRGSIPMKKKLKPLSVENLAASSEGSRPASSSSRRSARSARSSRLGGTGAPPPPGKAKGKGKPVQKEEEKRTTPAEITPEERLRQVLKAKEDEERARAKKNKEYLAEVDKREKLVKQMTSRQQNFTFDNKGELIMVNEVPGDKLPTPVVLTKSLLLHTPAPPADPPFIQHNILRDSLDPSKIFTPSDTVQPPAAESHKLAGGVTLKEGTVTKTGPAIPKDDLRMSKKEYTMMVEGEATMLGMTMRKTQDLNASLELNKAKDSMPSPVSKQQQQKQAPKPIQIEAQAAGQQASQDADISISGDLQHAVGGGINIGVVPAGGQRLADAVQAYDWDKTDYYDESNALVPNALARQKPDGRAILQSVGPRVKNPRDRFVYPEGVLPAKFLPAPIFPGTYGHGVVTSYLASDNVFAQDSFNTSTLSTPVSPHRRHPGSLNSSFENSPTKLVTEYTHNFPRPMPVPQITTVNPKLHRELGQN